MQRFSLPAGAGAIVLALALAGCGTTYGTGVSPAKQTMDDVTGMFALGGKKRPTIDYGPRAGIVDPPKGSSLPAPGSDKTETASASGDWPNDPDIAERKRKQAALLASKNRTGLDETKYNQGYEGLPGPSHSRGSPTVAKDSATELAEYEALRKNAKKIFAEADNVPRDENGKVIRQTLTDPPSDYRDPDPSAPKEFTAKKKKKHWWSWGGSN
jgi:hypothetical protein